MVRKSTHPTRLFEYLNGAVDDQAVRSIEAHVSECKECASVAALVRALKEASSESSAEITRTSQITHEHPDVSELASFFYGGSRPTAPSRVAAHVALCSACAEAISQYARAEHATAEYKPHNKSAGEVPAKAWEMIRDWEESSFAKLKPASEVLGQELLARLARLVVEQPQAAREPGYVVSRPQRAERVPVLVVSKSGEVRSVELFDKVMDSTGASVLKHAEGSERFDNKAVHALFDLGQNQPLIISELITMGTARLERVPRSEETAQRADYFIIED